MNLDYIALTIKLVKHLVREFNTKIMKTLSIIIVVVVFVAFVVIIAACLLVSYARKLHGNDTDPHTYVDARKLPRSFKKSKT
jgi:hypothetical protein